MTKLTEEFLAQVRRVHFPPPSSEPRGSGIANGGFSNVRALVRREFPGLDESRECGLAARAIELVEREHFARLSAPSAPPPPAAPDPAVEPSGAWTTYRPDHGRVVGPSIGKHWGG